MPTNIRATVASADSIALKWTNNSWNETGFVIERKDGGKFKQIGKVGAGVTTYRDTTAGKTSGLTYRVKAINAQGASDATVRNLWTWSHNTNLKYYQTDNMHSIGSGAYTIINKDFTHNKNLFISYYNAYYGSGADYVYFFYQDASNWYRVAIAENKCRLEKSVNGTITTLATADQGCNNGSGQPMQILQVTASDSGRITFARNANFTAPMETLLDATDTPSFAGGKVAFGTEAGKMPVRNTINLETTEANQAIHPMKLSVSPVEVTMNTRGHQQLATAVIPWNATNQNVAWTSSNPAVATVNASGYVVAVREGRCKIVATAQDGGIVGTANVVVDAGHVPVQGFSVAPLAAQAYVGESIAIAPIFKPTSASNKKIAWTSSDINIAKVSAGGVLVGIAPGTAKITGTTQDGSFAATVAATVVNFEGGAMITGKVIGTNQAIYGGNVLENAFDGKTNTYAENVGPGSWVGLDFGSAQAIGSLRYYPRPDQAARMKNGKFQVSNNPAFSSEVVDIYILKDTPMAAYNLVRLNLPGAYRYARFLNASPDNVLSIAELEFYQPKRQSANP
jgi:hypothetical protein